MMGSTIGKECEACGDIFFGLAYTYSAISISISIAFRHYHVQARMNFTVPLTLTNSLVKDSPDDGHMIPLFEMARLFAVGGHHVTIITTPSNASILQNSINKDVTAGHQIALDVVPFPSKEVGLPDGLENFFSVTDIEAAGKLYHAMTLLRQNIEEFIDTCRPDYIVSDMFHPWTADVAVRLDIPRLVFQGVCMFAQSLKDAVRCPDSPHLKVQSDYDPFVIPGLPDPITMTRS
ncbi:hypothetical protein F0562_011814 [Nyssa sinensis]|uniref:Uncharacterized protein n=1 Tax=Nyssa sinensis TaxID=561372 RepID=A0A5J4ZVI4_9ASTE|nr:hypothetical protein F0562_011814 [Nyssa sinensis]